MPIEVYTGKPGNGKTAFMMVNLIAESEKGERPVYASGIEGLIDGLATIIDNPETWNEIDPNGPPECTCGAQPEPHCHVLRNGAKWYVDEAWKWFGHLHSPPRQTPLHVLALAEHRHRGIDMVWTTQGPNQLYPFSRPLIAQHRHHIRRYNTNFIDVFAWEELQEDVKSSGKREAAMRSTSTLPKAVFGMYKSAAEHTIKTRIPMQVLALPLMILAIVLLGFGVVWIMAPDADQVAAYNALSEGQAAAGPSQGVGATGRTGPKYATLEAYVIAHRPRIATAPWTAPVFDDRAAQVDPMVMCMSAAAGSDANGAHVGETCSCRTEQGTPYAMTAAECRMVARQGAPYNPYRQNNRSWDESPSRDFQQTGRKASAPFARTVGGSQISVYGDLGLANNPQAAPR